MLLESVHQMMIYVISGVLQGLCLTPRQWPSLVIHGNYGSRFRVNGMKRQNGISRIDENWELIVSYSVIIEKNKNLENPFWRLWLLQSLCAKCYGSAFKNKFLRQFQTSYHITTVIPNLRRKNLQKRMQNRVVRILDALWQFCSFVFVPQRRPKD